MENDWLSAHFRRSEFACKCGCGFDTVDAKLVDLCEMIRWFNGDKRIVIDSGCRCLARNTAEGGAEESMHLWGRAADMRVDDPQKVYDLFNKHFPTRYGFGVYHNRIHVDSRSGPPARWDRR